MGNILLSRHAEGMEKDCIFDSFMECGIYGYGTD